MQIKSIALEDNISYISKDNTFIEQLNGLGKVSLLIGSNNSGKSKFLRTICKTKEPRYSIKNKHIDSLLENAKFVLDAFLPIYNKYKGNIASGSINTFQIGKDKDFFSLPICFSDTPHKEILTIKGFIEGLDWISIGSHYGSDPAQYIKQEWNVMKREDVKLQEAIEKIEKFDISKFNDQLPKKVYIPILRTLDYLNEDLIDDKKLNDILEQRSRKNYGFDEHIEIFTGQSLYSKVRDMLLGDKKDREAIVEFQNFLRNKLFDNKEILLIPHVKSDVLYISIDGFEKPIFDLGDGIQSIIILTFLMFMYDKEGAWFFIEEPEQNLHPGMQRKLLEVMTSFHRHQFWITTHSNHFLDMTIDFSDIAVYKFEGLKNEKEDEKEKKFYIEQAQSGDTSLLKVLGVQNSSVFLSNCTIWVEGITDRLYLRKYLEIYQKDKALKYMEDLHYSFVEYGGNNITHRSFLDEYTGDQGIDIEHLCAKLLLIADNDNSKAPERKEFLRNKLGERFYELQCNEIENSLTLDIIKKTIKTYEEGVTFKPTTANLKNTKIGIYVENHLLENTSRRGGYKTESGTIKDKVEFCKRAIQNIKNYDDLGEDAKLLTEKVYGFIKLNNQ